MPGVNDTQSPQMKKQSATRWVLTLVPTILILFLLLRSLSPGQFAAALRNVRLDYFAAMTLLHIGLIFFFTPMMWRLILRFYHCRTPYWPLTAVWIGSTSLKVIIPLKLGRLLGVAYLARREKLPGAHGVSSLLLLHFINFFTLFVYLAVGLWLTPGMRLPFALPLTLALPAIIALLPSLGALAGPLGRLHPRLGKLTADLVSAFAVVPLGKRFALVGLISLVHGANIAKVALALAATGAAVSTPALFLYSPLVYLAANLPVTWMGIGARELTMVYFFQGFAPEANLLAAGMLLSLGSEIVTLFLSLPLLPKAIAAGLLPAKESA